MSSPDRLWYRATLAAGDVLLGLPEPASEIARAPKTLRAAVRLADAEGLSAALETWTGEDLDWRPFDDASLVRQRAAQGLSFEVAAPTEAAPLGTRCILPLRAIARRVAVPPLFRGEVCVWRRVRLQVELDVFDLPEAQRAQLAPGRVLLLPGSFDPAWRVYLCNPALGLRLPARWGAQRVLALDNGVAASRLGALRACLQQSATMSPGALLGFGGAAVAEIEVDADADWKVDLEGSADRTLPRSVGRLLPALGGQALHISSIVESLAAADAEPEPPSEVEHESISAA